MTKRYKHNPRDMRPGVVYSKHSGNPLFVCTRYCAVGKDDFVEGDWVKMDGTAFKVGEKMPYEIALVWDGFDVWEQRL